MSGITDELINKVNMDYTEAAEKLKAGEIDAFFCTAGTRTEGTAAGAAGEQAAGHGGEAFRQELIMVRILM